MTTYTLITGASSGIGKEIARLAAADNNNIVLVARNNERLQEIAKSLATTYKVKVENIAIDLAAPQAAATLYETIQKKKLSVTTLINNAGVGDYGHFASSDISTQSRMVQLNITSLTELTRLFLPNMLKTGGNIMNVGSVASFFPGPLMSVYFASKAYVLSFSEALSEELRGSNVSVTCLCPGSTKTDFGNTAHVSATHSTRTSNVTAAQVAAYGWREMQRGTPVAVYGLGNRGVLLITRFFPRSVVRRLVHRIQR